MKAGLIRVLYILQPRGNSWVKRMEKCMYMLQSKSVVYKQLKFLFQKRELNGTVIPKQVLISNIFPYISLLLSTHNQDYLQDPQLEVLA